MHEEARKARENAIAVEAKKDGLHQKQNGDWRLSLTIAEMDPRLTAAPMGARFQVVLVEIGDDDAPKDNVYQYKKAWRDLGATQQAGMRCKDPRFWAFLREELHYQIHTEEDAAEAVREILRIASRSDLGKPGYADARSAWHRLDETYEAWQKSS